MNQLRISIDSLSSLLNSPVVSVEQASGSGNSKVYRVRCQDGADYAVKFYFQSTVGGLSRLEIEYSGLAFMWENGIRYIPRPLIADRASQVAVYEFVNGREIVSSRVTADDVGQAVRFAAELRRLSQRPDSQQFPPASEACFSIDSIIGNIEDRFSRVTALRQRGPTYDALSRFLSGEFAPALTVLKEWVVKKVGREECSRELMLSARTLSPSDFGFHNALKRPNGALVFLDFEYFGWDDPAKMIADFILHPAMDLGVAIKSLFVERMLDCFSTDPGLRGRLESLYPFFGLKWCMIMLNEFIPKDLARRAFAARSSVDSVAVQTRQLGKSRAMLQKIMGEFETFPYSVRAA